MTYNRKKAANYASTWAFLRNPEYHNFDGQGGDCTNFVSQCLYAGCGEMNYAENFGWYYTSLKDRAAAWSGVSFFYKFLTTNLTAGPKAVESSLEMAEIGDVIQLSFDGETFRHSLFVIEISPKILIAAHTDDSLRRPLSDYNYVNIRLLHII